MNGLQVGRKRLMVLAASTFALACQATEPVITSFGGAGQLTFNALDDGTNYVYRVEWAPTASGAWRTFDDQVAARQQTGLVRECS